MSDTPKSLVEGWKAGWVNNPPVTSVAKGDGVKKIVDQLRRSIADYMPADTRSAPFDEAAWEAWAKSTKSTWDEGGKASADDPKLKSFRKDPKSFQGSWTERRDDGFWVLDRIDEGCDINLVYVLFGAPIGILCMDQGDPAPVAWVATHPGAADAGATLIEAAAGVSSTGRLTLTSLHTASTFYQKLGFVNDGYKLTLTPDKPLWGNVGGKWRLTQYNGTKYFKPTKPLPPTPGSKQ